MREGQKCPTPNSPPKNCQKTNKSESRLSGITLAQGSFISDLAVELSAQMKHYAKLDRRILEYLKECPHASDTLEGIAKWWVARHQISETVTAIQLALEVLQQEGSVSERRLPDGQILYLLNKQDR